MPGTAFVYLNRGLGVILFFVGVKMIISRWYHINALVSLAVIGVVLVVTVVTSLRMTVTEPAQPQPETHHPTHRERSES